MRFTEEHEQFRKSVRAVIESEINPYVDEWEAAGIFPAHELFPKLANVGMFGLEYDPEFGGQGADHTFTVVLGEELGATAHCAGVPMAIAVQARCHGSGSGSDLGPCPSCPVAARLAECMG